jgi:pSer/pThr/pTyr-binding forkhead associated (FHA) protein
LPGTCIFDPEYLLRLDIKGAEPMAFNLIGGEEIILGRKDPSDQYVPDLDLSSFDAFDMGISRRHAALMLNGKRLTVMDLRSSNGTYINDALLDPMEAHQLRDGDMLRMGQLEMRVSFQK